MNSLKFKNNPNEPQFITKDLKKDIKRDTIKSVMFSKNDCDPMQGYGRRWREAFKKKEELFWSVIIQVKILV